MKKQKKIVTEILIVLRERKNTRRKRAKDIKKSV